MKVLAALKEEQRLKSSALGLLLFEEEKELLDSFASLCPGLVGQVELERFTFKKGACLFRACPGGSPSRVFVVGLGSEKKGNNDVFREGAALLVKAASAAGASDLQIWTGHDVDGPLSLALAEGAHLGGYRFDRYREVPDEERGSVETVYISGGDEEAIEKGSLMACSQMFARDLANEPGNVINPLTLADRAREVADQGGFECRIYDEKELAEMNMGLLLAVGGGSKTPPRLIHLVYRPEGEALGKVALVGKGITFDTGGLNLKPGEHMRTMKGDKTGASVVLGVFRSLARLRPPVEVHGLIGAAENAVDSYSYRPDDIVRGRKGKTVEIDNTDAEGRLTLADVLAFACELKPSIVVDIATLTGACAIALGPYTAGLLSNDDSLAEELLGASRRSGERFWRLPMDDERLRKKLESPVADLVNSGGREGGALTAAMFLEAFVDEGIRWAHLDIAGVDTYKEPFGYYSKGATGFGARTLLDFLTSLEPEV
ncbi:leucyl aminopeptidase [Aminithiophilus ramosus]|uniref:Leucyl aminopeptidase n=2 Tax=Synergistales TaxID=649776 RepID=A0ACD1DZD2_9BACT|nr:leucyl aminopeptidase [Aminithiophilus ramosus]QTX31220.1 leucyl aminopeptidase [Aminithiophilus ramosus]QVL37498.1 leucyl aminopeptidase [Synergistota bacterium]